MSHKVWGQLFNLVCFHSGCTRAELEGRNRAFKITAARHVLMFLARKYTNYSLSDIGNLLGGRDHSTVHFACKRVTKDLAGDQLGPVEGIAGLVKEVERDLEDDISRGQLTWEVVDLDPKGDKGGPPMIVCRYHRGDGSRWLFTREMTRLKD